MPASCYNELWGLGTYSKDAAAETEHRLQETSGTSFADSSGNGRTGTGNAAVTSVTGPTGYLPNAVQFGSPYYIALPAINETWTEGTIAVWAKPKSPNPDWSGLVVVRDRFTLHVRDYRSVRYNWSGASPQFGAVMGTLPNWDEWYRIVLTVDSSEAKVYSNGSLLGTNTLSHPSSNFTGQYVRLGHDMSTRYFNGDMAHAAMFSKAWNTDELAEDLAGPEPLNSTAGTVQVQSGDPVVGCILEVGTAPTYDDRNNGALTITYRWFVNDVYQSTGGTFDTTGLSVGDVIKYQSRGTNNGGYDPAQDTDSSNSITIIDFLCLNQIFGEGTHTADSRLNSWINGDSDDNGTGDVLDAIGSLDGSWSGTPAYATGIKNHYKSLDLSGSNYVTLAAGTSYFPDPDYNNFSVCLRFNADSLTGKQVLWETGGAQVCQVLHLDGTTLYALTAGANVAVSASVTVGSGDHSVVMTVDDDVLTLYVDDQEPVTAAVANLRANAGSNAGAIGRANTMRYADQSTADTGAFSGLISDVATFIGVLNQYEAAHYIAGYEPLNTAAGTVAVQGGGSPTVGSTLEVGSAATYDDRNNGSVVITYRWFVNDVYDSTSATFDTTGLEVDDVIKFYSRGTNDGGYDLAEDTASSNSITLVDSGSTYTLACDNGSYSLTGQTTSLLVTRKLLAASISFTLTGQPVSLAAARKLLLNHGSFSLDGQLTSLAANRKMAASSGPFLLTGQAVGLAANRKMVTGSGSFLLTGQDVGLIIERRLTASFGSFLLSGQDTSFTASRKLAASSGSFLLSGQDALLVYTPTGGPTYTLSCAVGNIVLDGAAANLLVARKLLLAQGSFTLDGQDALLKASRRLSMEHGLFVLTGLPSNLTVARRLQVDNAEFVLTGIAANLVYDGEEPTNSAAWYYYTS